MNRYLLLYNYKYFYKGYIIISNQKTLTEQFKSFYTSHKPKNFEDAIEKFSIFGGVNWGEIDTSKPSFELIEKLILDDYRFIRNDITELTMGAPVYHAILSGIAMGDGKTHSSYKRAKVDKDVGDSAVEVLQEKGLLRVEKAKNIFTSWSENETVDNKLLFTTPFYCFWFAFVSPLFKGIRDGDYKEIRQRFTNHQNEFIQLSFVALSQEFLKLYFKDDTIMEIGSYWDRKSELDIFAKTKSGKTIVGSCKYINKKINKSELNRLHDICESAKIKADVFVIFSKKGFSSELKSLKSEALKLFTIKNLKSLAEDSEIS